PFIPPPASALPFFPCTTTPPAPIYTLSLHDALPILDFVPLLQRYSYLALVEETSELSVSLATFQQLLNNVISRNGKAAAQTILEYGRAQCQIVLGALEKREQQAEKV